MGIVTKTIGQAAGRDYSTLQSWADDLPVNLVTNGNSQVGECYNDAEYFGVLQRLLISGNTTNATQNITLTTAAGQSFRDDASAQSNPLKYDQSKGVAIGAATGVAAVVQTSVANVIFKNLQIKQYTTAGGGTVQLTGATNNGCFIDNCIIETMGTNSDFSGGTTRNCILINRDLTTTRVGEAWYAAKFYNCTLINPSSRAALSYFFREYSDVPIMKNCAIYGATAITDGGAGGPTFTTCYTDIASPPSGCTTAAYNSTQFVSTTTDWRIPSGSAFVDHGTTDTTNAAIDIVGTARPEGSAYDVGCWEYKAATPAASSGGGGEGKSKHMRG